MELLNHAFSIAVLILGFGFVVFFHELGHFIAAKWVGIKVEQFAVGFGHAVASWRRGMGFMWGSSNKRLEEVLKAHIQAKRERQLQLKEHAGFTNDELATAAAELGLGETEYRINWIPLGGYVKMLGQDDMNPNATSDDPRSYNRKSVGARMIVVSAGVIMNVILAALLFMGVFMIGHKVSAPMVGDMYTDSPARLAGFEVGDRIVSYDGSREHSFTQLMLDIALSREGKIPVQVERTGPDGKIVRKTLEVEPTRPDGDSKSFYAIGIVASHELRGVTPKQAKEAKFDTSKLNPKSQILPGDVITAVNGTAVNAGDFRILSDAIQKSGGRPVPLTVKGKDGRQRTVEAAIRFQTFFPGKIFNIAGMQPLPMVSSVSSESKLKDIKEGDVIAELLLNGDPRPHPTVSEVGQLTSEAGESDKRVDLIVERDGTRSKIEGVVPGVKVDAGKRGLGLYLDVSTGRPIVADVLANSAAAKAGIKGGALITKVDGKPVANWFEVRQRLRDGGNSAKVEYVRLNSNGQPTAGTEGVAMLDLERERATLEYIRYADGLQLAEHIVVRQTNNPLLAAQWGVIETRDMLRQFYVTLRRLLQARVSATNFMGPVGIVHAGSIFAFKGWDWLIWFLAMISANLAVVNFLPIPIVDGGLFMFLIFEKVSGRPLSPKMQTVAQLVGLAIILSVFLLVTYQDIRRLIM